MTEQRYPQHVQHFAAPGLDTEGASTGGLHEDLIEREELDRAWAEFSRVRASLAEVMSDDELRALGINVEALDERP